MAIKLLGVPGEKLLTREKDALTQDFLMITHPVFIVDDTARYLALLENSASRNPFLRAFALTSRRARPGTPEPAPDSPHLAFARRSGMLPHGRAMSPH